jgi:exosortase/archaeosortase|tara:strand:+ start:54 stop:257 length:204 start_codon:yes stop_codon:yes gene_type:complete
MNIKNLIKYFIMFLVTTTATKIIPTCGVLKEHAIYVGLISASTFALIDICSPEIIIQKEYNDLNNNS